MRWLDGKWIKLGLVTLLAGMISGCVRPEAVTPTPDPNATQAPEVVSNNNPGNTSAPTQAPGFQTAQPTPQPVAGLNAALLEQTLPEFGREAQAGSLQIWLQDTLIQTVQLGYSFRNPSGLNCVGTGIQDTTVQLAANCASEPGAQVVVAQGLFLLNGSMPSVLIAGEVLTELEGGVINIVFQNGNETRIPNLINGRYFFTSTRPNEVVFVSSVQLIDISGQIIVNQPAPQ